MCVAASVECKLVETRHRLHPLEEGWRTSAPVPSDLTRPPTGGEEDLVLQDHQQQPEHATSAKPSFLHGGTKTGWD